MKDKIYIFGHKNPDTDSVCASISLSYLQNVLGYNTEPRILSNINNETRYVLNKFKIKIPKILNDVSIKISDINYHRGFKVSLNDSVYSAYFRMKSENMSSIPIVDKDNKFVGVFAMKDIAKSEIVDNIDTIISTYENILEVIKGIEIIKVEDEINGTINKEIIITSNEEEIINSINEKVKLIIVTNNKKIDEEIKRNAKKNKISVIRCKFDNYFVRNKIVFANIIENSNYTKDIVCVNENTNFDDLNDIIEHTRHSYYPVVDNNNNCLGLIKLSDLRSINKKKVILVDHNEIEQSVDGLSEAEIMGVYDHHKLGTIATLEPINFRSMIVGSTCTIVYEMYKENKVKVPMHIAALLLSGIISDTLLLKSPTTTEVDKKYVEELSKIARINPNSLALSMFKANDVTTSKSLKEIVYVDFKNFTFDKKNIGISVVTTLNSKAILKQKSSYIRFLNKESELKEYDIFLLVITDIFKNGSYILFNEGAKDIIKYAFGNEITQGDFLKDVVSRKKQIVPALLGAVK